MLFRKLRTQTMVDEPLDNCGALICRVKFKSISGHGPDAWYVVCEGCGLQTNLENSRIDARASWRGVIRDDKETALKVEES